MTKKIILFIMLLFNVSLFSQTFKMGRHGLPPQYMEKQGQGKPCGHGNQPACIPLTDWMPALIIAGLMLAGLKLKYKNIILKREK